MSQYFVDTNEWGASIPAEWGVLVGVDVWSMEEDSQDAGRKVLKATVPSDGNHILSWSKADSGIDCSKELELYCTFRVLSYSGGGTLMAGPISDAVVDGGEHAFFGAGGFWYNSSGPVYRASSSVRRLSDGSQSNEFSNNVYTSQQPVSTIFHIRVHCSADPGDDTGRTIQTKLWKEGEAEPASYQSSDTVATNWFWNHGDGEVGFMAVRDEEYEFLTLGIATEGDAAPTEPPSIPDTPSVNVDSVGEDSATFSTSAYTHPDSKAHESTRWQVSLDSDFSTTLIDETSTTDLELYTGEDLDPGQLHYIRALHTDVEDGSSNWSTAASFTTDSCGDAPVARVGVIDTTEITVTTDVFEVEYNTVRYRLQKDGAVVETISKTGSGRFEHTFTGLTAGTEYEVSVLVRRDCGLSPYSDPITVTTLSVAIGAEGTLGCPPAPQSYYWNPDSNPPSYQTWRGIGWYTPFPGQPLSGTVTLRLRWPNSVTWDVEISDDLGETYTSLDTDVTSGGTDGDLLHYYDITLDTTTLTDGADYRLKATSQGEDAIVVESLSFVIDNDGIFSYHDNREADNTGSWAVLWGKNKPGDPLGNPGREYPLINPWYYNLNDGALFCTRGAPWTVLADLNAGIGLGGDVTVVFHVWNGEGGLLGLQGMLDCELWKAGIAFFANGSGDLPNSDDSVQEDQVGLFVGVSNFVTLASGCCDDIYTSGTARLEAQGRPVKTENFTTLTIEGTTTRTGDLYSIPKFFHKSDANIPRSADAGDFDNNFMLIRTGHAPGNRLISKETCGRRYSMYAVRAKVEVDPTDHSRVHIQARVDGPSTEDPESGYWHFDDWISTDEDWTKGHIGLVSQQTVRPTYGKPQGVRVFPKYAGTAFDQEASTVEPEDEGIGDEDLPAGSPQDEPDEPEDLTYSGGDDCPPEANWQNGSEEALIAWDDDCGLAPAVTWSKSEEEETTWEDCP